MKKILAVVLALVLCMALCAVGSAAGKYKIGILAPAVTHGWVAGVAYNAEQECLALADEVDYKLYTSNNAEEMTTQLDDLMTWGAQAIVAFPQWEGMEVPIQNAIDSGITVVNFDIVIDADGVYRVTGDNEGMGVESAKYIVETGLTSLGTMIGNFIPLATYTDPLRTSYFPQNWTIYYWAYWMVWCVAAPFFIGSISRGRTIRQTILGGYVFGVGSTIMSFIILGNYSMHLQVTGAMDFVASYLENGDPYGLIISIIETMPCAKLVMVVLLLTMIAFYATSFDSIALTASCYSYHRLGENEMPSKLIQLMWCILLILLPIALIFAESSMNSLQTVSIIAAFPIGIVMILIVWSFLKDGKVTIKARETEE